MERRTALKQLAAGLALWPTLARAEESCVWEGASPQMVTGPFPPAGFRETAGGRPNPGAWIPVSENDLDLAAVTGAAGAPVGQVITLDVRVLTAECRPVPGAVVELWQCDAKGLYNHKNERRAKPEDLDPNFGYWGSGTTDDQGRISVRTIVPARYPAGSGWHRPPHLHWSLAAQGLGEVTTQSYFDGDLLEGVSQTRKDNDADLILQYRAGFEMGLKGEALESARRRAREELLVRFATAREGVPHGELTLRLG